MSKTQTLYVNNGRSTLNSTVTTSSASFTVADPSSFPTSLTGGQFFYVTLFDTVNIEIVKVTAVSGSTFTVTRAQQGTTAHAFASASTTVGNRLTAADLTGFARSGDNLVAISGITGLALPSTVDPTSYVLGDATNDNTAIIVLANTTSNIWSFTGYPAQVYSGTVGSGASTTSITLATATVLLPDTTAKTYIIQFTSGALQGTARFVGTISSGSFAPTVAFSGTPGSSDTYVIYRHLGSNVSLQLTQLSQMLDPTYVTTAINYVLGDKRLNTGSFQMYDGSAWNNYALNYVASTSATIGSYSVSAVNGGYAGFDFTGSYHSQALLASSTADSSGVYRVADTAWDWRWDAGVLAVGTVPYANVSGTPNLTVYAPLASPTFTGTPAAPTAAASTNTTQLATTAFVKNSIVFTGNATAGTKTYAASGIIEQWFESFQAAAGSGVVTITYPVAFVNTAAKPLVSIYDANMATAGASNFVAAQIVSNSLTGCTINLGVNGGGTRDITLSITVRGT